MRTTLDIDADVLQAAKELAAKERTTAGKVISNLFRRGLRAPEPEKTRKTAKYTFKNGVPVLPSRGGEIITMEHIRSLMDEEDM
jgi:hypothetical protein